MSNVTIVAYYSSVYHSCIYVAPVEDKYTKVLKFLWLLERSEKLNKIIFKAAKRKIE